MNTHLYPLFITHYTANADEDLQNIIKDNKGGLYKPGQIMVDKGPMAKHLLKEYARRRALHYQDSWILITKAIVQSSMMT